MTGRGTFSHRLLLAAVAAGTAWIALYAWRGFSQAPGGFLNPLFLLAAVVAVIGTATRWWRWPAPVVVLVQMVVSGSLALLMITGSLLPTAGAMAELRSKLSDAVDTAQQYSAPVPTGVPAIDPLLILCGLACLLLVDLLACTLHRVPLAGLPLLTIYSIPVSMVGGSISWWVFTATAAGFLAMLFLQESDQVSRWGRPIALDRETGDPISLGAGSTVVRRTAGSVGGVATALAVALPALIPSVGVHMFDFGPGRGGGDDIHIDNPVTNLVRDLRQGPDTPLIQITTTERHPAYLRILALTRFTDTEWSPGDRDVPADHTASGQLPPPQGVAADVPRHEVSYDVKVLPAFDSRWLPTQLPASRVQAAGDWRYDDSTMDFLAGQDGMSTSGMSYTMSSWDLGLTAARLEDAGSSTGKVSKRFTDYPADIPPIVRQLAAQVTDGQGTRFDKAVALQNWFRETGGFTYSTATKITGSGSQALVDFLTDGPGGRTGYCEQFASAMALMARVLGIPARVAVGFLNPDPAGPNTWVYSAHDLHAWPELYFDGAGWVRFEPTPSRRASDVPAYTLRATAPNGAPTPTTPARPSASVSGPTSRQAPTQNDTAAAADRTGSGGSGPWGAIAGVAAVAALAGASLLLPALVRRRRRDRRLTAAGPEDVWAEIRDTARDLGVAWPPGQSPRATRRALVGYLGIPLESTTPERPAHGPRVAAEGVAALDRIVGTLELSRYARDPAAADRAELRADARTVLSSLAGGATRAARRRADWWPRSVLTLGRPRAQATPATIEARYGGVVDHVG